MASPESEPTIPQALGRLRVALNASFEAASRSLGLTPQQAELLCAAMAPSAVGELAEVLHCDRSNVSHLVGRAERRGFVQRGSASEDGRVSLIELTPEGERLARRFIAELEAHVEPLLDGWSSSRRRTAGGILTELAAELEAAGSRR